MEERIDYIHKGREIKLGFVTQGIFGTQGKTKNIYVWKVSKLSQTRSYKAHILILNISAQEHTQDYTGKGNSNQAIVTIEMFSYLHPRGIETLNGHQVSVSQLKRNGSNCFLVIIF